LPEPKKPVSTVTGTEEFAIDINIVSRV